MTKEFLNGNAVVGQSGGPTAAINATLAGVIRGFFAYGKGNTLYGMRNGMEGFLEERLVNLNERFAKAEDIDLLENTPAAALGSCRKKLPEVEGNEDYYEKIFTLFRKYNIRYFFYIGGNDSMDTVAKLSKYSKVNDYEMRFIGIPKTIDNDLMGTDHTPGFGSAAKYVAVTMSEIIRDCAVYTKPAVTVVEIMGRDAGWLTASSAIGRVVNGVEPDLLYLPERNFSMEEFLEDVQAKLDEKPNVVVAVSEGIHFADGRYVGEGQQSGVADVFGHKYLSGTGKMLETIVKEKLGCKVRSVELNISQRCAAHLLSSVDIEESVRVGKAAAKAATEGASRVMMTTDRVSTDPYISEVGMADVQDIANQTRHVPAEYINERGNHVTDECCRYLQPLIMGERQPKYEGGLPVHVII